MLEAGFKSNRKFSRKLHQWDLLERVHEQLLTEDTADISTADPTPLYRRPGDGGTCTPFHEADCKELFHMAVSRINSNNPNIGKDEKVREGLGARTRARMRRSARARATEQG